VKKLVGTGGRGQGGGVVVGGPKERWLHPVEKTKTNGNCGKTKKKSEAKTGEGETKEGPQT